MNEPGDADRRAAAVEALSTTSPALHDLITVTTADGTTQVIKVYEDSHATLVQIAPDSTVTAACGASFLPHPVPTNASCRVTLFISRVQISSESGAFEVP